MPGKVNPVMAEALIMTAGQVIASDSAILQGGLGSYFELNMMMPLMAYNLLNSIQWMANAVVAFTERCLVGIQADRERCQEHLERNLALATGLAPTIGYDRAAEISKEAFLSGQTVRQVALEQKVLPEEALDRALDPRKMTEPGM